MSDREHTREIEIGRYLDGTLSSSACDELQQRCERDPAVLDDCIAQMRLDHALRATLARPERDRQARERIIAAVAGASADDARGRIMQVVRKRVGTRLKRRAIRRRYLWLPVALAAAAALVIALVLPFNGTSARSSDVVVCSGIQGEVTVWRDGDRQAMSVGMDLRVGDDIHTASGATVGLRYVDDATEVSLVGDTQLGIRQEVGGKRLNLTAGAITCSVAHQVAGQDLRVVTTGAVAVIKGTQFTLQCAGNWTKLSVTEGLVQFERRSGGTEMVGAGMSAETLPDKLTSPGNLLRSPGFEGDVSAWHRIGWSGRTCDDAEKHSGERALRLSPTAVKSSVKDADVYQDLQVEPGAPLRLSLWVRGQALGGQGAVIQAMWLHRPSGDGDSSTDTLSRRGLLIACDEIGPLTGTFGWRERSLDLTAPPEARLLRVRLLTHVMGASDAALWVDDVQLIRR